LHGYEQTIRAVLLPAFDTLPVARITRAAVQDWIDGQAGDYSPNTVRARVNMLRSVLNRAVQQDAIRVNPCQGVRLPAASPAARSSCSPPPRSRRWPTPSGNGSTTRRCGPATAP
jgi:hypothetical protein